MKLIVFNTVTYGEMAVKPIFNQREMVCVWACIGIDPKYEHLALPKPTCWYPKTLMYPNQTRKFAILPDVGHNMGTLPALCPMQAGGIWLHWVAFK